MGYITTKGVSRRRKLLAGAVAGALALLTPTVASASYPTGRWTCRSRNDQVTFTTTSYVRMAFAEITGRYLCWAS